jgi:hypothetical protein
MHQFLEPGPLKPFLGKYLMNQFVKSDKKNNNRKDNRQIRTQNEWKILICISSCLALAVVYSYTNANTFANAADCRFTNETNCTPFVTPSDNSLKKQDGNSGTNPSPKFSIPRPSSIAKATVTTIPMRIVFEKIHVVDDKDGFGEGDGEIILDAIIHAGTATKKIHLLYGDEDIGDDQDYSLSKETKFTIPSGGGFTISTSGCESDVDASRGCVDGDDAIGTFHKTFNRLSKPPFGDGYHTFDAGDFQLTVRVDRCDNKAACSGE